MGDPPVVGLALGVLRGVSDDGINLYRSVRYAAPARRWSPPQPAEPWVGLLDADQWGPDCPQEPWNGSRAPRLDEDCLTLNIWSPTRDPEARLPVLVWFFGGSFLFGSASSPKTDGTALARRGAVVVSVNYRVGLFGFLSHPGLTAESPHGSSGNYGLLDQIEALRWVRRHIGAFGGDPHRVTAFGVSAGSASLALLTTSPLAQGCFDQVILQSPGAFRSLASLADSDAAGMAIGPDIEELRALPWPDLLGRTARLVPKVRALTAPRVLRPICDGWVIPNDERAAYGTGRFHPVPTLVGTNTDEGRSLTATWTTPRDELFATNFGTSAHEATGQWSTVADAFADTQFNLGARGVARAQATAGQPTWRYVFTRRAPGHADGPHHGGEVGYVFGSLEHAEEDETGHQLADTMGAAWVRFAATGDPNGGDLPSWPPYAAATDHHLELGEHITVGSGWRRAPLDFLDRFYG
ncbi:MAG: carboxylesterase/lipase family protein [Acidimicrobiales bacterium]